METTNMEMPKYLAKILNRPITAIVDTREQYPFHLQRFCPQMEVIMEKLPFGDYSLKYPNCTLKVCIERKSIDDFVQSIIRSQSDPEDMFNNFKTELIGMRGYRYRMVIVECTFDQICKGNYRSKVHPNSVLGFVAEWACMHQIPILFANNHFGASYMAANILWKIAMREIKESLMLGSVFPNLTVEQLQLLGPIKETFLEDITETYQHSLEVF